MVLSEPNISLYRALDEEGRAQGWGGGPAALYSRTRSAGELTATKSGDGGPNRVLLGVI
jgi:hypothetical protein